MTRTHEDDLLTHECPIHGRYDTTYGYCPRCWSERGVFNPIDEPDIANAIEKAAEHRANNTYDPNSPSAMFTMLLLTNMQLDPSLNRFLKQLATDALHITQSRVDAHHALMTALRVQFEGETPSCTLPQVLMGQARCWIHYETLADLILEHHT